MAVKKPVKSTAAANEEAAAASTPVKRKNASFADAFSEAKATGGGFPPGKHEVFIIGFELLGEIAEEGEPQGKLSAQITYEGDADEKEGVAGKEMKSFYSLCGDDGEAKGGCGFIKKDLDVLGYEDVKLGDLEDVFEQIVAERPKVVITVKQNGQYTNAYLQGLANAE